MEDSLEKAIICKLQEGLPLVAQPYKFIAEDLGISEQEVLDIIEGLSNKKMLRRIGAILHHRSVGIKANAMVVWCIPEEKVKDAVKIIIKYPEVTHCYERKVLKGWSYNIYTMIHSENKSHCEDIILNISKAISINNYEVLYSTKELKKSSMKYFVENVK
jgi:DNA-binding Lrp family transcriptional regulator